MAKTINATFYTDPGHGWLRVATNWVYELGISDKVTQFSYQDDRYTYLEEDCDAPLFENTALARGYKLKTRTIYQDGRSEIRNKKWFQKVTI